MAEDKNRKEELKIAVEYIEKNYSSEGESRNFDYVTSADIVRELSEMVILSVSDVSRLMIEKGFVVQFVDGKPYWAVYRD